MADDPTQSLESPSRLAMLENTGMMDSPSEAAFDRLTRLASGLLHAPVALVSLVDGRRQFFKSARGLPDPWAQRRETPLSHSFCQHVVRSGKALVVANAPAHPLVQDNLAIRDLGVMAYAGMPLQLASGSVLGSFCVIDVVAREWKQEELDLLEDLTASVVAEIELRMAVQAQRDVLAIVSHDLKAPLTAIQLTTEAHAVQAQGPRPAGRAMRRIASAARRMEALVHEVLDHGALHGEDFTLATRPEPVAALVQTAVEGARPLADERGVGLFIDGIAADLAVNCDATRLGQALSNLVHNAVEHTPYGQAVHVNASRRGAQVQISVEDEGSGIAPEEAAHLFTRGWRGKGVRRRGHGLGLYIAAKYVHAHRGQMAAANRAERGAAFTMTVPCAPALGAGAAPASSR